MVRDKKKREKRKETGRKRKKQEEIVRNAKKLKEHGGKGEETG